MDKYKTLKAVQGLIASLDEQIYRMEQFKRVPIEDAEPKTVDQYFEAIKNLINGEVKDES